MIYEANQEKRSTEVQARVDNLISLASAVRNTKGVFRNWSGASYDVLRIPALSVWVARMPFVGSAGSAKSLQQSAAGADQLASFIIACRRSVRDSCESALGSAEERLKKLAIDGLKQYDAATASKAKATKTLKSANHRVASAHKAVEKAGKAFDTAPEAQQQKRKGEQEKAQAELRAAIAAEEEATTGLQAAAEALKVVEPPTLERLEEAQLEIESEDIGRAFDGLQEAYAALAVASKALYGSDALKSACDEYKPTSANTTVGGSLTSTKHALNNWFGELQGYKESHEGVNTFREGLNHARELGEIFTSQLQTFLRGGLHAIMGPQHEGSTVAKLAEQLASSAVKRRVLATQPGEGLQATRHEKFADAINSLSLAVETGFIKDRVRPDQAAIFAYQSSRRTGLRELQGFDDKIDKAHKKDPGSVAGLEAEKGKLQSKLDAEWAAKAEDLMKLAAGAAKELGANVVEPTVDFMQKLVEFYAARGTTMPAYKRHVKPAIQRQPTKPIKPIKPKAPVKPKEPPPPQPEPPQPQPDPTPPDEPPAPTPPEPTPPEPKPPEPKPPDPQLPAAPEPPSDEQLLLESAAEEAWRLQEEAADEADAAVEEATKAEMAAKMQPKDRKLRRASEKAAKLMDKAIAKAEAASEAADQAQIAAFGLPPAPSDEVLPALDKMETRGYKKDLVQQWVELLHDPSNQRDCTRWGWDKWEEMAEEAVDDYDISMIVPHEVPMVLYVADEDDVEHLYALCVGWGYTRESCEHIVRTLLRAAQMNTHIKVQTETDGPWKAIGDMIKALEGKDYAGSEICKGAFRHQTRQVKPVGGWQIG